MLAVRPVDCGFFRLAMIRIFIRLPGNKTSELTFVHTGKLSLRKASIHAVYYTGSFHFAAAGHQTCWLFGKLSFFEFSGRSEINFDFQPIWKVGERQKVRLERTAEKENFVCSSTPGKVTWQAFYFERIRLDKPQINQLLWSYFESQNCTLVTWQSTWAPPKSIT